MKRKLNVRTTNKASDASFFDDQHIDNLIKMNTELLTELWIIKDRMHILEKILQDKKIVNVNEIDFYKPTGEFLKFLDHERGKLIKQVIEKSLTKKNIRTVDSILSNTKKE
tara:strand:+ start:171 stop:503 length:333 start_codon:yes stop_codon:yes gene_type:complete